jgi:hypothetical protein
LLGFFHVRTSLTVSLALAAAITIVRHLGAEDTPAAPSGVQNPKALSEPVKLVAADIMVDGSMSVCGKLRDSQGKEFWFLLRQGPYAFGENASRDGLYVGYMTGHIPESARTKFDGWAEQDFWLLLERTIRDAFRWDPESGRLIAKDPNQFDRPSQAESFGASAAKRLLRRAESLLKREHSYMETAITKHP